MTTPNATSIEALDTARKMMAAAVGRGADMHVELPIALFVRIAEMLKELAETPAAPSPARDGLAALKRIANLEIRGGRELLELGAWRKITAELQAIAQDAIGQARIALRDFERTATHSDERADKGGISY